MAINIKNAEVDNLIQQLRQLTGLGPTDIVKDALERQYQGLRRQRRKTQLDQKLPLNLLGYIPRRSAAKNIRMSEYVHKSHHGMVLLYHLVFHTIYVKEQSNEHPIWQSYVSRKF